jgi:hypothetical protein
MMFYIALLNRLMVYGLGVPFIVIYGAVIQQAKSTPMFDWVGKSRSIRNPSKKLL